VGAGGCGYVDYTPPVFWKNIKFEYAGLFFSLKNADRSDLFKNLIIWKDEKYRKLQGTYPVIFMSFAGVKSDNFTGAKYQIFEILEQVWNSFPMIETDPFYFMMRKEIYRQGKDAIDIDMLSMSLNKLCNRLYNYYGKKVLIFLDEYDTPMQEAWLLGYWDEIVSLFRNLFNNTFKTNPALERCLMMGMLLKPELDAPSPLGSKEPHQADEAGFPAKLEKTSLSSQCQSIFSDLNNMEVVTTTSEKYETAFGFTESEVFWALEQSEMSEHKEDVKKWYDGFIFGNVSDIYNPWSITNYLDKGSLTAYWANTSANGLVENLIKKGSPEVKQIMEDLLKDIPLVTKIDEQIVFHQLNKNRDAIWSLLLASGYLKVDKYLQNPQGLNQYTLSLTNFEVKIMFESMIGKWFDESEGAYNEFIKSLLRGDVEAMNEYMNEVALSCFSYFDTGKNMTERKVAERFYHGFVLGLIVELKNRYMITSNRESGFGRYDVMLEPLNPEDAAIIIEFKVYNSKKEDTLEDTAKAALDQIKEKGYCQAFLDKGISRERISCYGFAFMGKEVLIVMTDEL